VTGIPLRRKFLIWAIVGCGLMLSSCQTNVDVAIKQNLDGTGEVKVSLALDAEAARQAGDLKRTLRVADLESAGWRLIGPTTDETTGGMTFSAAKSFRNPGEATLALNQLTGSDGPFGQLVVDRSRTPVRISSSVQGDLDFTKGYDVFGDEVIAQTMQSTSPLGNDPVVFSDRFGAPIEQLLPITLTVELPGALPEKIALVPGQIVKVDVGSATWNTRILAPLAALGIGSVSLVGLVVRARRRRNG
jgi:hypothetical protein